MGKLGNLAYNIGTSLNKEDINTHRQGITPTRDYLATLSSDEQLAYHASNQALLDENKGQLEGEKESGDEILNHSAGTASVVGNRRQREENCRLANVSAENCDQYNRYLVGQVFKEAALLIVPTEVYEIIPIGKGFGVVVKGSKKAIAIFKSKDEAQRVLDETKRVSRTDTPDGYEPDNDSFSNRVSGNREYYNFNLMTKQQAEEIASKIKKRSPVQVPSNAIQKIEQKPAGYAQIKYTWTENGVKYESRWHTRTPGAPANQTNSWVVTRKTQGSRTQKAGETEYLLNNGKWISESQWNHALMLRRQGRETQESREILDRGHIKDVE